MRVPLSWLIDFTPLAIDPTDEVAVRELSRVADSLGLVTEEIVPIRSAPAGVVTARVLEIDSIEGADRVRLVHADRGDEVLEIVCGATNFAVGDVVPLAPVGTTLPNGMTIARRKMRGVTSNGMLCSGAELGLDNDAEGLLILASPGSLDAPLPSGLEIGMAIDDYLGLEDDVVFDLSIEPNRPDCLSIAGVARDLAARLHLPFEIPTPHLVERGIPAAELVTIAIESPQLCHGLVARVISELAPMASPRRIARRLALAGMRPISAVVDVTNYVMLELGQPTHAYDLDRLAAPGLTVRFAHEGETLRTLDGVERALFGASPGREPGAIDGVICDAAGYLVGLAGVMGGEESETHDETSRVLLEVADFDPIVVGRAAARHNLRSEASQRFWRGTDPAGQHRAADRVLELIVESAAAAGLPAPAVAPGTLEDREISIEHRRIHLRTARLNAVLGTALDEGAIARYLTPIGFHSRTSGDGLDVEIPTYRPDARLEIDVIEEVARHHGYEQIVPTIRRSARPGLLRREQLARRNLRRALQGYGCDEAWTSSLADPSVAARAGRCERPIVLSNPIVAWESTLRTHLLPGLLGALRHNASHRNAQVRLFEIGHVFSLGDDEQPRERELLGVALAGEGDSVHTARDVLERLRSALRLAPGALRIETPEGSASLFLLGCHPTRSSLLVDATGTPLGALGEIDAEVLAAFELEPRSLGWLVCDLTALVALPRADLRAQPVSRYPSSDLDLAFVLANEVPAGALESVLSAAGGALIESIRLLDVYRSDALGDDVRSLTYRLRFCAIDHTLSESELAAARASCITTVEAALPARLRS